MKIGLIAMKAAICLFLISTLTALAGGATRIGNRSPTYAVPQNDISFHANHTAWVVTNAATGEGYRELTAEIEPKILDMIDHAEKYLVLSFFLFDNFYAEGAASRDVVGSIVEHILHRKRDRPGLSVAVILDPSNKAYSNRVSPAEATLRANGIDVFYSDLIAGLKKGTLLGFREGLGHVGRWLDIATFRVSSRVASGVASSVPVPAGEFDNHQVNLEMAYNAALVKANHRKLVVADTADGYFEVLVSSANPHNASASHINNAIAVRGAPAIYTYNVLREDMMHSARLGNRYAHWHDKRSRASRKSYFTGTFPAIELQTPASGDPPGGDARVTILTEQEIETAVLQLLRDVSTEDEVDIQMFYLSRKPVVEEILKASTRVSRPIRLLLDANKDSFNKEKDGTPNRQVARHLLKEAEARGGRIEIRWYATHGEQNHVKTVSVRNPSHGSYRILAGSCNWTGRNMAGVNMEANVLVDNAPAIVTEFRERFDDAWENKGSKLYSLPYSAFADQTAGDRKWTIGEKPFYYSTF